MVFFGCKKKWQQKKKEAKKWTKELMYKKIKQTFAEVFWAYVFGTMGRQDPNTMVQKNAVY